MSVTIKDVAEKAGFSVATISKYINGGSLREANRKKIEQTIEELNFKPNSIARGLKKSTTKTVGVLVPSLSNLFTTTVITAIERTLEQKGYGVLICDCNENKEREKDKVEFLLDRMVDGIITTPYNRTGEHLDPVKASGTPIVLVDNIVDKYILDSVLVENLIGTYNAVRYLASKGHKNIAIISGEADIFTAAERLEGYVRALKSVGLPIYDEFIRFGNYKIDSGYVQMNELWKLKQRPTVVFVTNYEMTIGAVMAANSLGINIPQDLSLVGFDDIYLEAIKPRLTVVSQPMDKIGETAASLLINRMNSHIEESPKIIKLDTKLEIRESVSEIE